MKKYIYVVFIGILLFSFKPLVKGASCTASKCQANADACYSCGDCKWLIDNDAIKGDVVIGGDLPGSCLNLNDEEKDDLEVEFDKNGNIIKKSGNIEDCKAVLGENVMIDKKLPKTVHMIIVIIKIAVPVLLVIFGMLDLMKGITSQKEDEIKKGQQLFIKRLISGVLVFFVISAVQFVISLVGNSDSENIMDCANCFINGDCTE